MKGTAMSRLRLIPILAVTVAACSRGRAAAAPPATAVSVRVADVSLEALAAPVSATGTLGPKEEVPLSFKIGGVIGRMLVDEGQAVRAGDTLAVLDVTEIDAA